MIEIKITKAIQNERKELACSFICKEWDYSCTELELLRQAKINWDSLDLEITWLLKNEIDEQIKELRQQLYLSMKDYCNKFHITEEVEEKKLYDKYKIKSRTELSSKQLEEEIESYRTSNYNLIP